MLVVVKYFKFDNFSLQNSIKFFKNSIWNLGYVLPIKNNSFLNNLQIQWRKPNIFIFRKINNWFFEPLSNAMSWFDNLLKFNSLIPINSIFLNDILFINFFNNFNSLENKNKNINLNLILSNNFVFFSYLEGFDDVTAVILLKDANTTITINRENYLEFDKKILANFDWKLWYKLTKPGFYFSDLQNLFEYDDFVPFSINQKLVNRVYVDYNFLRKFDIGYIFASNDLLRSFYYEPFFFFRDKIEQSLDDFRLITFFRERTLLFEFWVFRNEQEIKNRKIIFQPLSNLYHKSELKASLRFFKWIFSYKQKQQFSNYLNIEDTQDFSLDKNFIHTWNYWIGAWHELIGFAKTSWVGWINFYREKLYTPQVHTPSKYYRFDNGYWNYNTRALNFAFIPDLSMMWGHYNPHNDLGTSGYNRFFHFGDTFLDAQLSLKLLRYQLTVNNWGEFEYLVQDFAIYQPAYIADPVSTLRLPMILLMCKKYTSIANMNMFIRDYNAVFQFKQHKPYSNVKGELLFLLSPLERLESLRDIPPIDQRMHSTDRVVNAYFGYNQSEFLLNYPAWFPDFFNTSNFYSGMLYDYEEDKEIEQTSTDLIFSLYKNKYNYNSNISIYFNKLAFSLPLKIIFHYFNERVFDDPGYVTTNLTRNENFKKFNKISWGGSTPLLHFEVIPDFHFNWWLTVLNNYSLDWWIFKTTTFFKNSLLFLKTLHESFSFGFINIISNNVETYTSNSGELRLYYNLERTIQPILEIKIEFLPLLRFFKTLIGSTEFDSHFLKFFKILDSLLNFIPNPYSFFTLKFNFDNPNNWKNLYEAILISQTGVVDIWIIEITLYLFKYYTIPIFIPYRYMVSWNHPIEAMAGFVFSCQILYIIRKLPYMLATPSGETLITLFHFLNSIFFYHNRWTNLIRIYVVEDANFVITAQSNAKIEYKFLPVEFFVIGSFYGDERIWTVEKFNLNYSEFLPFLALTYFWNLKTFEDFESFVLLWLTYQLNKDTLNKTENIEYINAINQMDYSVLKINNLEFERYKNYVLKQNLYKPTKRT